MDPQRCLALPIRLFWVLAGNVDRLRAQNQIELLDVSSVSQAMGDGEALKTFREQLLERMGTASRVEQPRSAPADIMALMQEV